LQGETHDDQGTAIRVENSSERGDGDRCHMASPPGSAGKRAPSGARELQGEDRDAQGPAIRVKRLSVHDDTVAHKRRKNPNQGRCSKRPLEQESTGQKRLCFRSSQMLGTGVGTFSQHLPSLQHQGTPARLSRTEQDETDNTHPDDPIRPQQAELGEENHSLTTGLSGQYQGGLSEFPRSAPPEPSGGARSPPL